MAFYRKKPVIIEAFQMTRARRWDNQDWPDWLNQAWDKEPGEGALFIDSYDLERERLAIGTLEGVYQISWGDWIIRGVKGAISVCKRDIFAATYEIVEKEESIMEGPDILGEQMGTPVPGENQREKMWDELTDAEKVERMHVVIQNLRSQLSRMEAQSEMLMLHEHGASGRTLVDARNRNMYSPGPPVGNSAPWF